MNVMTDEQRKLAEDNIKLVYQIISKYYRSYLGDEDIVQCGMIGLCQAATSWDKSKGAFATLAGTCICNQIKEEFRKRQKRIDAISLDTPVGDEDSTLEDFIESDEEFDLDITDVTTDRFLDKLTKKERMVCDLKLQGYSIREIAKTMGVSHNTIHWYLKMIRRKYLETNPTE